MSNREKCSLTWSSFTSHSVRVLTELFISKRWTDITLVTDDLTQLRSHKFLLSASSSFFQNVLVSDCQMVYLRGISGSDLECLLEYLYLGHTQLDSSRLERFLQVARDLGVADLSDLNDKKSAGVDSEKDGPKESQEDPSAEPAENISMNPSARGLLTEARQTEVSFECPECGGRFARNASMRTHFRSKHKGLQYPLNYNPYTNTNTETDTSITTANSEPQPYQCDQCGRGFQAEETLKIHVQSVHEAKRYRCSVCGGTFSQSSSLAGHIKSQHEGLKLKCPLCPSEYSSRGGLRIHKRNVHHAGCRPGLLYNI